MTVANSRFLALRTAGWLAAGLLLTGAHAAPVSAGPWPSSSREPVRPLAHDDLATRCRLTGSLPDSGFRFVAFGDQRALADGEWQLLMDAVAGLAVRDPRLLFMVDTGDIVQNGTHTDQFAVLEGILAPATSLPYWVGVGNHEVHNNRSPKARAHVAQFLAPVSEDLGPDRLYYSRRVGPALCLFLDTNDWVYGVEDEADAFEAAPGTRLEAQFAWLEAELAPKTAPSGDPPSAIIVVMHHPFIQSSEKHRDQARRLWDLRYRGRTLADILAEGGVTLVLCGHTHTYERFRLRREDGRELVLVNLSGRPRSSWWPFADSRKADDLRGKELESLREWGWRGLGMWSIVQEDVMLGDGRNQLGLVEVDADGTLRFEVAFLDSGAPGLLERTPAVLISRPSPASPR